LQRDLNSAKVEGSPAGAEGDDVTLPWFISG